MPSRYIRDGLLESTAIAAAGEPAEVLFVRLLLVADDYGRFDGRLSVIERKCWPDRGPGQEEIEQRLAKLAATQDPRGVPLIVRYEVDQQPYLLIPKFRQRTRALKSKYPDPPQDFPQDDPQPQENAGQVTDTRPTHDGQPSGRWRSTDGHPQARSRSSTRTSSADAGHMPDKRRAHPSTPGEARAQQAIAEGRSAREHASEPPGGSVAAVARAAGIRIPTDPTGDWKDSTDTIDHQGSALGMQRLAFETDDEYITRIQQRMNLG